MKSLFISCHFDDAIFSCGKLISIMDDPTVMTIFGGIPENKMVLTAYDQKAGFDNAEQAIISRREEDAVALTLIRAKQEYMEYVDFQYGQDNNYGDIESSIIHAIRDYDEIYLPLGFSHNDHEIVGSMIPNFVKNNKSKSFYVFMDMPYYVDNPILATEHLKRLPLKADYEYRGGDLGKKMLAIACYKSQFNITNIYHLMADERYYKI